MEKYIVATGKTIDLALAAALEELKLDRDSVSVEVLENAKSGFLGIGASPAKVKVTYEAPDEMPKEPTSVLSAASRSKRQEKQSDPASAVISKPGKKPESKRTVPEMPPREMQTRKKTEKPTNAAPKQQQPAAPQPRQSTASATSAKTYAPAPEGSVEARIETFLSGLLAHMGSDAVPHAYHAEEQNYKAELVGDDVGLLIGRRGDTLDAIQYLTSYVINRDAQTRVRVSVDAGDYRLKREETLRHLATKMAGRAIKYRRNFTLEPMNAYERHVIHAALQEYPEVTTFSTGTEPHRRIVVAYAREKTVSKEV